jgi:hypothetical protein
MSGLKMEDWKKCDSTLAYYETGQLGIYLQTSLTTLIIILFLCLVYFYKHEIC